MSGVTESGAVSIDEGSALDQPVKHVHDLLDSIPQASNLYSWRMGFYNYSRLYFKVLRPESLSVLTTHCHSPLNLDWAQAA